MLDFKEADGLREARSELRVRSDLDMVATCKSRFSPTFPGCDDAGLQEKLLDLFRGLTDRHKALRTENVLRTLHNLRTQANCISAKPACFLRLLLFRSSLLLTCLSCNLKARSRILSFMR